MGKPFLDPEKLARAEVLLNELYQLYEEMGQGTAHPILDRIRHLTDSAEQLGKWPDCWGQVTDTYIPKTPIEWATHILWKESLRLNSGAAYEATHTALRHLEEAKLIEKRKEDNG